MSDPVILVSGFSATNKVPGFFAANIWASGRSSASLYQRRALVVGLMGASSTATANVPVQMFRPSDADIFGHRSELACMVRAALLEDGVTLWAVPVTAAGGAVAASATITIGGTWTAAWSFFYRINGVVVTGTIASGDSTTQAATKVKNAINSYPDLPVTADSTGAVVTVTVDSAGVHGNQYIIAQAQTEMPSTATSALAGATALTTGAVPFTSGTGTETYTTLLAALATSQWDRIAVSCIDTTSLGLWRGHMVSESASGIGHLEQFVFATNGTLSAAISLSQATLNEPCAQHLWLLSSERHPSELAASHAAKRAITEESNPSPRYMNVEVKGAAPQAYRADWAIPSVRDSALNAGVTPLLTTEDGKVVVNRGITTYSFLGTTATADFRCLDINNVSMGQYGRQRLGSIWNLEIIPEYDRVGPDPGPNDPETPAGKITPRILYSRFYGEMKTWETNGWAVDVDTNKPVVIYDPSGARLMADVPIKASKGNYQVGVNVRQLS